MYKVPNGEKIEEQKMLKAYLDRSESRYFLDIRTGKVLLDSEINDDEYRFFEIPKVTEDIIISWMEWLAGDLVPHEDIVLARKLLKILKKDNPIENFHKAIEGNWSYGWPQIEQDFGFEELEKWFDSLPFDIIDDWEEDLKELGDHDIARVLKESEGGDKSIIDIFREDSFQRIIKNMK